MTKAVEAPGQGQRSGGSDEPAAAESTSVAEWIVAALGAALLLATVAYMLSYGLTHPPGPPVPMVERLSTERLAAGWHVRFRVRNAGNGTASALLVRGELREGDRVVEESESTIDYVPQRSERQGGLFFSLDPAGRELVLRAEGYADP